MFCVDDKTAIQALDRKDPILPLSPGRAERHGFEYVRHGTLSLCAALATQTGEVVGKTTSRHTSQKFVAFLTDLIARQPEGRQIHIILDNLSAHKTKAVKAWLDEHPRVEIHYTPTYSSWLNQVRSPADGWVRPPGHNPLAVAAVAKIASLAGYSSGSDDPPTGQMPTVRDIYRSELAAVLSRWADIAGIEITNFNRMLVEQGLPPIVSATR